MVEVVIVGGGPAGLSAALMLGRCRRSVLVCDSGQPRNAASHGLHGFLTRDGILPFELLRIGREQLRAYPSVRYCEAEVVDARRDGERFEIVLADGERIACRKLLLATGVVDELPELEGLAELYGRSVFHCPYCDGWEVRDQPLAVYGRGDWGSGLSLGLKTWSDDVVLCTGGPSGLGSEDRDRLARHGVRLLEDRVARLEGVDGVLERIVFENGASLPRRALFFCTGQHQRSPLATKLGCAFNDEGTVRTDEHGATNVRGLCVAGDASRRAQFAVVAAAEGAQAAAAIHEALLNEDLA